ncbi:hypothetical protein [Actinomadura macrotermitis]|nr:hypothetical protein [Actinomadura macrotermitis]
MTALRRARLRGGAAIALLLLLVLGCVSAPPSWRVPGVPTLLLALAAGAVLLCARSESRAPGAEASASPKLSRALAEAATVILLFLGAASLFFLLSANTPRGCAPMPMPDAEWERRCSAWGTASSIGLGAWIAAMLGTLALLAGCAVAARRSQITGWAAFPFAFAGPVLALDLGHAVYLALT